MSDVSAIPVDWLPVSTSRNLLAGKKACPPCGKVFHGDANVQVRDRIKHGRSRENEPYVRPLSSIWRCAGKLAARQILGYFRAAERLAGFFRFVPDPPLTSLGRLSMGRETMSGRSAPRLRPARAAKCVWDDAVERPRPAWTPPDRPAQRGPSMAWSSRSRPPDGSTKAGGHRRDRIGPRGATGKIRRAGYVSTTSPLDPSEVREEAWVVSRPRLDRRGLSVH